MSARLRCLQAVVDELQAVPALAYVAMDLRWWDELPGTAFPSAFVVADSGGEVQEQPTSRVREEFRFSVWGYVRVPAGDPDGLTVSRETLYQAVLDRLYAATMQARLDSDLVQFAQNGAISVEHTAGPDVDEGALPPFGVFRLPCRAILHYARGAL